LGIGKDREQRITKPVLGFRFGQRFGCPVSAEGREARSWRLKSGWFILTVVLIRRFLPSDSNLVRRVSLISLSSSRLVLGPLKGQ